MTPARHDDRAWATSARSPIAQPCWPPNWRTWTSRSTPWAPALGNIGQDADPRALDALARSRLRLTTKCPAGQCRSAVGTDLVLAMDQASLDDLQQMGVDDAG